MGKILNEDINRMHELIYGKEFIQEQGILNKIKNFITGGRTIKPLEMLVKPEYNGQFIELDLTKKEGINTYSQICQAFINKRNPNAGITGQMMASSAKRAFQSTGNYVPPELSLSQLAIEGGLSKNPNAKPHRTNNPYNIGNYDNGRVTPFPNKQVGIDKYYLTIAKNYLTPGKSPEDLIKNFTNSQGKRYASSPGYESLLGQIVNDVRNLSRSILSPSSNFIKK